MVAYSVKTSSNVRPLAGAGIEIAPARGLMRCISVRPLAGAGIEIGAHADVISLAGFAPSRGRELKLYRNAVYPHAHVFAPSRGRELKFNSRPFRAMRGCVRPLAGAGIEIRGRASTCRATSSPPRGGGN